MWPCGLVSNSRHCVIHVCGLSLLLVHAPGQRVFLRVLGFPLSTETNISKFQFHLETVDEEQLCVYTNTTVNLNLIFFNYFILRIQFASSWPNAPVTYCDSLVEFSQSLSVYFTGVL